MHLLDKLGSAVRNARQEKKLSQRALAGKLNMSVRTIINLEKGKSSPRAETVFIVAAELDISLDSLILSRDDCRDGVTRDVIEFFADKTPEESNQYIALCRQADTLMKGREG